MSADEKSAAFERRLTLISFAGALLAVMAARFLIVIAYATDIPYWDQWDAEIDALYRRFMEGTLTIADLVAPHNEHRILFTRLWGLALFVANEYQFDNVVSSSANTALYTLGLGLFAWPVFRTLSAGQRFSGCVAIVFVGSLPYAWENVTTGFQNAFFFLNALMLAALYVLAFRAPGRKALVTTTALVGCSLFTLASGCLLAAAAAFLALCLYRLGRLALRDLIGFNIAMLLLFVLGLLLVPRMPGHDALRPDTLVEFLSAASIVLCWPLPAKDFASVWRLLAIAMLWWPGIFVLVRCLRRSSRSSDRLDLFLLGVAAWSFLQALSMAYSRGDTLQWMPTRYLDVLVLGVLANLVLAIRIVRGALAEQRMAMASTLGVLNVVVVFAVFGLFVAWAFNGAQSLVKLRDHHRQAQQNLHRYIGSGDATIFAGKPPPDVSYPNTPRLTALLAVQSVRGLLPSSIAPPATLTWHGCSLLISPGAFPTTPTSTYPVFGTYSPSIGNANVGSCTSDAITVRRGHVTIHLAGFLGQAGLDLRLRSVANGRTVAVQPGEVARERWQPIDLAAPGSPFVIEAGDTNPELWHAFSAPVERGRLSAAIATLAACVEKLRNSGQP